MARCQFTPDAREDLAEIRAYIARDNVEAAGWFLAEIERACDLLVKYPFAGHRRPDLTRRPLRFWPVRAYLIVYAPEEPLRVIRVLHGARDVRTVLRGGGR